MGHRLKAGSRQASRAHHRHPGLDPGPTFFFLLDVERTPAVYIVTNTFHGTLYTGVTSDLPGRIYQHRNGSFRGFTAEHGCKRLVWFEVHHSMEEAIVREKRIKRWLRDWKYALIEAENPGWRDLAEDFGFEPLLRTPGAEKKVGPGSSPG